MSNLIKMAEKEEEISKEFLSKRVQESVSYLLEYLKSFWPKTLGYSKHAVMGPAGKLLSILESGRITEKDALIGYIINVHNNTSDRQISKEGLDALTRAVDSLIKLRDELSIRSWLRAIREIDYAVFKGRMEFIITKAAEKKEKMEGGEG